MTGLRAARRLLALCIAALTLGAGSAAAHDKSVSYSEWSLRGETDLIARVVLSARQATLLIGPQRIDGDDAPRDPAGAAAAHFAARLAAAVGGGPCVLTGPPRHLSAAPGMVGLELRYSCPSPIGADLSLRSDALFDLSAGHLHFARVLSQGSSSGWREAALSDAERGFRPFAAAAERGQADFGAFFLSGARHMLGGLDHLAFLLGVLLTTRGVRQTVLAATGFTLGHSVSLAAAVAGVAQVDEALIEILIAVTIWLVAVEALAQMRTQPGRRTGAGGAGAIEEGRAGLIAAALSLILLAALASMALGAGPGLLSWLGIGLLCFGYLGLSARGGEGGALLAIGATTLFGLIHGFGFAGAVADAFSSPLNLGLSLAGFNLGLEAGQLLFLGTLALVGASLNWVLGGDRWRGPVASAAALSLAALGAFWATERVLSSVS